MDPLILALVGAFVFLGAATQRITGMGFALVASPLLVLTLGPHDGVQLSQSLSLATAVMVMAQTWRLIEWRTASILFITALVGLVPGYWVVMNLRAPVLQVLVGTVMMVAILLPLVTDRAHIFMGDLGLVGAGALSGFMNFTAGVAGPPVVLYKNANDWKHAAFVATCQVYFLTINVVSLTVKGFPQQGWPTWAVVLSCLAVGMVVGNALNKKVSHKAARRLVTAVALLGSAATVIKGITTW